MLTRPIATRTNAGIGLTVLWIAALAGLAYWKSDALCTLTLNEWGDFLAGAFAPLAFLWLVVGYMQQGEELQQSTDALRLQALELQNSVLQQQQLVEVARQQFEAERDALAYERELRKVTYSPKIEVGSAGGIVSDGGDITHRYIVRNVGHDAMAVSIQVDIKHHETPLNYRTELSQLARGAEHRGQIKLTSPLQDNSGRIRIEYFDGLGVQKCVVFAVLPASSHPNSSLMYVLADA